MDMELFIQQVIHCETPSLEGITSENAPIIADRLKAEADRYRRIDPNVSLHTSGVISLVGDTVTDLRIIALGALSHGDTFSSLHKINEAWQMFDRARELYQKVDDEVGWARTCIGRLLICVEMNSVEPTLRDAEAARGVFRKYGELDKLIKLDTNAAGVLSLLGEYQAAIERCEAVLSFMESIGDVDRTNLTYLYYLMGHAHQGLGNLRESRACYERTRELWLANDEKLGVAFVDLNLINIAQAQGHHKKALRLLHETIDVLAQHLPLDHSKEMFHIVEGYLFLNRYNDARDLAGKVIKQHPPDHENDDLALMLLQLAKAEMALGDFREVFTSLTHAEEIFTRLNAMAWLGMIELYRAQAAFHQGDLLIARQSGRAAAERFSQNGQKISHLMALLQAIRVEIADGQTTTALQIARNVQKMARELHLPLLSYEAHLLSGKIAEQTGKPEQAIRHYQMATGIMERIQRSLVLTSRPEFLADKQDSVQALVRLNLELGRTEAAFSALERAKAGVWLGYLSQLDHLRWLRDDPQTQPLVDELSQMREEHHWYYRAAHDPVFREQQHVTMPQPEAALEASARERRLSALTEQLYLHSSVDDLAATTVVPISAIQEKLDDGVALIAYYNDGCHLWAFVMDSQHLEVCGLPEPVSTVEMLLDKWQTNINRALRTAMDSTEARMLDMYALPLSQRLYDTLLRPFAERLKDRERLIIVPYGALHYLPFQLLHNGADYLIEQAEVVILPTASLLTRQPPHQPRQALAVAYSWDGRLEHTQAEARQVIGRFGGQLYCESEATQSVLRDAPCQVLHISAHGEYRMDQPDFSYIQLADGPLYTDDLFQHDLHYELVTLSACETGRSRAAAGDELIGLGRGFLFAGAGALIASLWRVDETLTLELMDELYHRLDSGASKAAALRGAQLTLKRAYPGLHPAYWGAFELIGNADPLTLAD
jgi:CHAT domain-containing protein/tetratricopeptide (TPR) repeat protein